MMALVLIGVLAADPLTNVEEEAQVLGGIIRAEFDPWRAAHELL